MTASISSFARNPLVRTVGWGIGRVAQAVEDIASIVITGAAVGAATAATLATYAPNVTHGQTVESTALGIIIGVGTVAAIKFAQGAGSMVCGALHLHFKDAIEEVAYTAAFLGTGIAGGMAITGVVTENPAFIVGAGVVAVTSAITLALEQHAHGRRGHVHHEAAPVARIEPQPVEFSRREDQRSETPAPHR